jgi:hypothetical protein
VIGVAEHESSECRQPFRQVQQPRGVAAQEAAEIAAQGIGSRDGAVEIEQRENAPLRTRITGGTRSGALGGAQAGLPAVAS